MQATNFDTQILNVIRLIVSQSFRVIQSDYCIYLHFKIKIICYDSIKALVYVHYDTINFIMLISNLPSDSCTERQV